MPDRVVATELLAKLFHSLSHPHRVRIIEELSLGRKNVGTLTEILGISQSRVSQHLSQLKSFPLVQEERDGKQVLYSLKQQKIATWALEGLEFIEQEFAASETTLKALKNAKSHWQS